MNSVRPSIHNLSIKDSKSLKQLWRSRLLENNTAYWIICKSDPNDYDSRTPLETELKLPEYWFSFTPIEREYARVMRQIALDFLEDKEEERTEQSERKLNLAILLVELLYHPGISDSDSRDSYAQYQWLARLSGRGGPEVKDFMGKLSGRREAYLSRLRSSSINRKGRITKLFSTSEINAPWWAYRFTKFDNSNGPGIAYQTFKDLVLDDKSDSKYAKLGDPLILTNVIRKHALNALKSPRRNLKSLGLVMTILFDMKQGSEDLGIHEARLTRERNRIWMGDARSGEGEEWDMIREASRIRGREIPTATVGDGMSKATSSSKKKNKKKKKKKKKKTTSVTEQQVEEEQEEVE
ncbi:hypothetical protein JCM3765_005087 [Sporobolomyces pararoseus]